ncbi:polymorphic toxin-type HINT domain-containing protein [Chryseobacterium sp. Leaf394]|uniref:polymorphic toxin-type HINT domain-containing protein n=1 Tax=Chryseobacterium sp. Leaf394 TaxID=1736361 RepID=UPI0006FB578E|nr:polymorphic toxin-type HINT domain-containing protein [Chryseobacterium sp. Leaf394]KQS92070.1 hypothetical protein ASG21_06345 [Chryseobacterium sp. Leaf394]
MDELEYITKNALMICDQGGAPDFFKPTYNTKVKIHGCLVATNMDATPLINIPLFKVCKISGGPCAPATIPLTWQDTWQVKIKGINSLIGKSTCLCPIGGKIEFMTSGQVPLPDDAAAEVAEMQEQAQRELDDSGNGDSVGEAGLVEGMIPVWGSGRDLINDIQTGDGWGAAMNAGFLIWDVASIAVGVVSFGAGTVAMQGAKAGVKGAIKAGAKAVSKEALQQMGKAAFKSLSKSALKSADNLMAKLCNISKVFACFTAETLIHTPKGLKKIEDIKIGDEVFSFDEENQKVTIRKVNYLFQEEVEEILEIETENGIISTTRNHPFYVNGQFKDAEEIDIGEYLLAQNGKFIKVLSLNYILKTEKVYNFEVEEDHCYFVGEDGVLVLNKCYHTTFFNAFPWLKGKVVVHHAIEQQVLKRYPGVLTKAEIHALDNLRGIPKEINSKLHLSEIRIEWNKFYKKFDDAGIIPTKKQLEDYARAIDKKFANQFNPPFSVWP